MKGGCMPDDKADLRAWIKRMREHSQRVAFPDTDLGLMDAIERVLDQDSRRDWPTLVHNQYLVVLDQRDEAVALLEEAMEWIERPVNDQDDAALFLNFEHNVNVLLYEGKPS